MSVEFTGTLEQRAEELAAFFGLPVRAALLDLQQGFGVHHARVAEDFRCAAPQTDEALLAWYRRTPTYTWELSAYHADPGFNYAGMCEGIVKHLAARSDVEYPRVLCVGDGIGDLTLACALAGLDAVYHDLADSVTARFAAERFQRYGAAPLVALSSSWVPLIWTDFGGTVAEARARLLGQVDAVVALDFFEHVPNVEEWAQALADALRPGGLFLSQNAFAVGDSEHGGSIPMHLSANNKYADPDPDPAANGRALWDTLRLRVGLERTGEGDWWRKR